MPKIHAVRLLDTDPANDMEPVVTKQAFGSLFNAKGTFDALFTVSRQDFDGTSIWTLRPDKKACALEHDDPERGRYAEHFQTIQRMREVVDNRIPGSSASVALCISGYIDPESHKPAGYIPYCRYTHPKKLGNENVYVIYHKLAREVVLFITPGFEYRKLAGVFMCRFGAITSFDTVCSWCGAVACNLKKCPCGMSRYCNVGCQKSHWSLHRPQCPTSKSYVDIS